MSEPTTQRIVVAGAGSVGAALGANLLRLGHQVRYAVRGGSSRPLPPGAAAVPLEGAGKDADLVVLAVPFAAVEEVVPLLDLPPDAVLVDTTNPFSRPVPDGYPSAAGLVTAVAGPGVRVVKAFNVLGAEHMSNPPLPDGHQPVVPVAGDHPEARARVTALARDMGFDAVDVGDLSAAPVMEAAARYWGLLAFSGGLGRQFVLVADRREG